MIDKQMLVDILVKRAKGYRYTERTDEYAVVDGERKLVKSKKVSKRIQPDVNAVKALITLDDSQDVTQLTDEQLQVEKLRLLRLLNIMEAAPDEPTPDGSDNEE